MGISRNGSLCTFYFRGQKFAGLSPQLNVLFKKKFYSTSGKPPRTELYGAALTKQSNNQLILENSVENVAAINS